MKTAVSILNGLFNKAEQFAHQKKTPRSARYSLALGEYFSRHSLQITEAMDKVCTELGQEQDRFVASLARRVLERIERENCPRPRLG